MEPVVSYTGLPGQTTTEDIEMFARKSLLSSISRAVVVATVAAVAVTTFESSTARAGSAPASQGVAHGLSTAATSDATDFSARRRHYRRGGGGAAAAAAFAGIIGTGIAIAASQNRRHYYYDRGPGYYGGGPVYYGGGQPYYGGQRYYGGHGYYGGGGGRVYTGGPYGGGGAFDTLTPHPR
ncbi:MAG: hypothetical protein V4517_10225 [Pseudomonadota bacterium]